MPDVALAQTKDMCALLANNPSWSDSLKVAQDQWSISPGAVLAIIDQESRFNAQARGANAGGPNPRRNFGYAQANVQTWNWFLRDTGKAAGARTDFALSVDFVGWHFAKMERRFRISRSNVSAHYLVYKMGEGGYQRGASTRARGLANRIAERAHTINAQLTACGF